MKAVYRSSGGTVKVMITVKTSLPCSIVAMVVSFLEGYPLGGSERGWLSRGIW